MLRSTASYNGDIIPKDFQWAGISPPYVILSLTAALYCLLIPAVTDVFQGLSFQSLFLAFQGCHPPPLLQEHSGAFLFRNHSYYMRRDQVGTII